jgi:signal transduction histidine kinase
VSPTPSPEGEPLDEEAAVILAIAAHELKNAMGGLGVVLARCEQRLAAGQPVTKEHIGDARAELRRLSALVNELLDGSRVDLGMVTVAPRPVDIVALTHEVVDVFRAARERCVDLDLHVPEAPLIVDVDAERLRAVLVNFLENAAKYAAAPSKIAVRLAISPHRDRAIRISVTDQGPGIHPDEHPRLFQRFFRGPTVAKRAQGLGLGLYVCRAVAEAHGGQVGVDSVHGRGATFWIDLPAPRVGAAKPEPA